MINDYEEDEPQNDSMLNTSEKKERLKSNEQINNNIENRYTEINNDFILNSFEEQNENKNSLDIINSENIEIDIPNFSSKNDIKIILLGEIGVGKSTLISRYLNINSNEVNNLEIREKKIELDKNTKLNIFLYDTVYQEKLGKFTKDYYRDSKGALIIFDLCDIESFNKCSFWINELKENSPRDIIYALIGNKSDKNEGRKVKFEDAFELAKDNLYYEVSAKTGNNISLAFEKLISAIINKQNDEEDNPDKVLRGLSGRSSLSLKDQSEFKDKKKTCC